MEKIKKEDGISLKEGDYILFESGIRNKTKVGVIQSHGRIKGVDFYIKYEDNSIPQYLSINELSYCSYKINPEEYPEYFI